MAQFIFEFIFEVLGEVIFDSVDRCRCKKRNIIICVLQYGFLIALFCFLITLVKENVPFNEMGTGAMAVCGVLLFFVILFVVLFSIEMWYVLNNKYTKDVTKRITEQYNRIIEKAEKLGMDKYIILPNDSGIAFAGTMEKPELVIRIYPRSYRSEKGLNIYVKRFDDDATEWFDEKSEDNIEICTGKAVKYINDYYGKKVRFLSEKVKHRYILEKEEFFNEERGCWEVLKDEKDDSKFTRLLVLKNKSEVKEFDFRR